MASIYSLDDKLTSLVEESLAPQVDLDKLMDLLKQKASAKENMPFDNFTPASGDIEKYKKQHPNASEAEINKNAYALHYVDVLDSYMLYYNTPDNSTHVVDTTPEEISIAMK